jgi:hypothetical protein
VSKSLLILGKVSPSWRDVTLQQCSTTSVQAYQHDNYPHLHVPKSTVLIQSLQAFLTLHMASQMCNSSDKSWLQDVTFFPFKIWTGRAKRC